MINYSEIDRGIEYLEQYIAHTRAVRDKCDKELAQVCPNNYSELASVPINSLYLDFDGEAWRANRSQLIKAGFKYSHKDEISMYFVKYIKGFKVVVELDSNLHKYDKE